MMKDKIRQILREETSGFDPKMLNALYQFMNNLTKGYVWYHDTPEKRFEHSEGSIWLINPETKKWAVELKKNGTLLFYQDSYRVFQKYFNMEQSDFERFITIWVEDVLNRGVSLTQSRGHTRWSQMEDVLNRGVSLTVMSYLGSIKSVKDVLKNGKELK